MRRPIELTLLEARERVGGVIATERLDGFTLECGPDSFITNKPWGLDLCERLGLSDRLIETDAGPPPVVRGPEGPAGAGARGLRADGASRLGPLLTTPILSWRGKLRMLMDLFIPRRDDEVEESLAGFVRRRLGREALERLVQPLVAGIYTADPNDLSLKATLPQFLAMERDHRSLILAGLREARSAVAGPAGEAGIRGALRDVRRPRRRHGRAARGPGRGAAAGDDPHRSTPPSGGSFATSRSPPGWSSCSTARPWRPTPSC